MLFSTRSPTPYSPFLSWKVAGFESVTAIQTLKAMAMEPQKQWEEQLAGHVGASFDVFSLGNWARHLLQFISKIVTALTPYFGAQPVIEGQLTAGELIAFMLSGRVAQPVLRLAQRPWPPILRATLTSIQQARIFRPSPMTQACKTQSLRRGVPSSLRHRTVRR